MPFCPKCKFEYVKNIDTCHDCGEKLTEELPDDIKYSEIKEIPSFIRSTFFSSAYGTRGAVGDTTTIFVPDDKLEECNEIIKQMFNHI